MGSTRCRALQHGAAERFACAVRLLCAWERFWRHSVLNGGAGSEPFGNRHFSRLKVRGRG